MYSLLIDPVQPGFMNSFLRFIVFFRFEPKNAKYGLHVLIWLANYLIKCHNNLNFHEGACATLSFWTKDFGGQPGKLKRKSGGYHERRKEKSEEGNRRRDNNSSTRPSHHASCFP